MRPARLHLAVCGLAAILCIALAAVLHAQAPEAPPTGQENPWQWPAPAVDQALSYIRLVPDDMNLRDDYVSRDGCRLDVVDRLMRDPVSTPG
ncbi:MAG TPA: hypothetical protein VM118_13115, partial [Acidobacteriota bacterium]|nr:hypothetical protein [Acidobacteriota bacterium]